jgi:hypothetical protein
LGCIGTASVSAEVSLPLRNVVSGRLARIFKYERINQRCPADDFFKEIEKPMRKRFFGQCDALTKQGAGYVNHQRFCPLHGDGKPLWEFKEHDHRLYCIRAPVGTERIDVVLLSGWTKDKRGKTEREDREIERAKSLYYEFLNEFPGGIHEPLGA